MLQIVIGGSTAGLSFGRSSPRKNVTPTALVSFDNQFVHLSYSTAAAFNLLITYRSPSSRVFLQWLLQRQQLVGVSA
jgi:hypothetical protein